MAAQSEAASLHQGTQLPPAWLCSCRPTSACLLLTCARPDLWVLECQQAHGAKESNLLEALGLQIVTTHGGFLTLAFYRLHVFWAPPASLLIIWVIVMGRCLDAGLNVCNKKERLLGLLLSPLPSLHKACIKKTCSQQPARWRASIIVTLVVIKQMQQE